MAKKKITYQEIHDIVKSTKLKTKPDIILAVSRGGLIIAQMMAYKLGITNVHIVRCHSYTGTKKGDFKFEGLVIDNASEFQDKTVLVCDDIIDTGDTMRVIALHLADRAKKILMFAPFVKPQSVKGIFESELSLYGDDKVQFVLPLHLFLDDNKDWLVFPWDNL